MSGTDRPESARPISPAETGHRRSKRPASPLAGPYGHPFHAIAVTLPIGAWTASVIFDVMGLVDGDQSVFVGGAKILIIVGIVGALLASVLGLLDLTTLQKGSTVRRTALIHMTLNIVSLALWSGSLAVRATDPEAVPIAGVMLSLAAFAVLGASGWLGGKLAYHYGVRVADETTQKEGFGAN